MSSSPIHFSNYISTEPINPPNHSSANAALLLHPCLQSFFCLVTTASLVSFQLSFTFGSSSTPPAFFFLDLLKILQWNAANLCTRSVEFLHFVSILCISRIQLQLFFRLSGFVYTLLCDQIALTSVLALFYLISCTLVAVLVILVRQSPFFSELSTSSLSLLESYPDYLGANISLKNLFTLS